MWFLVIALLAGRLFGANFDLIGQIVPGARASVSLHGASAPFESNTLSDTHGRFRFRKIAAGTYTVAIFEPGSGETRQTVEVGPGVADSMGRVKVTIQVFDSDDNRAAIVSARELSIPVRARREYEVARKLLSRPDVEGAIAHLEHAVQIAPQFSGAWNQLGVIAYQSRRFPEAESYFRKGLAADAQAFEPLVNLGGVLLNLGKTDEALQFNLYAVLRRPNEALANSQLGMSYYLAGNLDLAGKYLTIAKTADPAHFSHPQLMLAEIHLRRHEPGAAVEEMSDFLRRHPDAPEAAGVKAAIARLQQ